MLRYSRGVRQSATCAKCGQGNCLNYFETGTRNCGGLNQSYTGLLEPEHTAYLSGSESEYFWHEAAYAATNFPFWKGGTYHWGVRGMSSRWECDDFPNDDPYSTIHRIYAR